MKPNQKPLMSSFNAKARVYEIALKEPAKKKRKYKKGSSQAIMLDTINTFELERNIRKWAQGKLSLALSTDVLIEEISDKKGNVANLRPLIRIEAERNAMMAIEKRFGRQFAKVVHVGDVRPDAVIKGILNTVESKRPYKWKR